MELKEVDTFTWRPVMVSSYIEESKQILLEDPTYETARVVSLLEELLVDIDEVGYYFSEDDGII